MKYCTKCGRQLENDVHFCPECGNDMQKNNVYNATVEGSQTSAPNTNTLCLLALIFGASGLGCSIIFSWWGILGLLGIGVSIAGLILSVKARKAVPDDTKAKLGLIFSIIGLALGVALTIMSMICVGCFFSALSSNYFYNMY